VLYLKRETLFLKTAVILIGFPILALCLLELPWVAKEATEQFPAYLLYPVLIGLYGTAIPFLMLYIRP
jgi:hypothetical protein